MKLKIKSSSWSGWVRDYKSEENYHEYDVILNKYYVVDTLEIHKSENGKNIIENQETFSFRITDVKDESIVIQTTQSFITESKKIENVFTIKKGKETKLVMPSLDSGTNYYLTLE